VRLLYVIPLNLSELGDFLTEDVVEEGRRTLTRPKTNVLRPLAVNIR